MSNSTRASAKKKSKKPAKPNDGFPLFAHQNGQWAKKVCGKLFYFGKWDDPAAALNKWLNEKADLLVGRTPRTQSDELTVKELGNRFLTSKLNRVNTGELTSDSYRDYYEVAQHVADVFGKNRYVDDLTAGDFETLRNSFASNHGPTRLAKDVTITRMLFRYGYEAGVIDRPVRFGPDFKAPSRKSRLKARRANGRKDFDSDEIARLIDAADTEMKAMILLGINAGLGQNDVASLQREHLDLEKGWMIFPRPKTEVERRCPLWPETIQAIRDAMEKRPKAKSDVDENCIFITRYGNRFVRHTENENPAKRSRIDTVSHAFKRLADSIGINGKRNFYSLRHSFETQAGESRDQVAVDLVMGHSDHSMAANYRHRIGDVRLKDVVEVVRVWLWPDVAETE